MSDIWSTSMPSQTFDPPSGAIGGDWRFPAMTRAPGLVPGAPAPTRVLRNPTPAATPLPPVRPNINVPVGQVAQSGSGSLWDALRALFSGQPSAQSQGMTGMLGNTPRATDALGNPFNRFG